MTNPTDLPGPSVSVMTLAKAPLPDAEKARALAQNRNAFTVDCLSTPRACPRRCGSRARTRCT